MRLVVALALSICFVVCLLVIYYVHVLYFPVAVIFYSALLDAFLAALVLAVFLYWLPCRYGIDWLAKVLLFVIWLLGGYAFAISVPTVIDRSLSMYILEKLDQRGGAIREESFRDVFVNEYMNEYRLIDVRLTEQVASGTVVIDDGCVKLTERGREIARFTRFFRTHFLARNRLLNDDYTDVLVDPLGDGSQDAMGYECE